MDFECFQSACEQGCCTVGGEVRCKSSFTLLRGGVSGVRGVSGAAGAGVVVGVESVRETEAEDVFL